MSIFFATEALTCCSVVVVAKLIVACPALRKHTLKLQLLNTEIETEKTDTTVHVHTKNKEDKASEVKEEIIRKLINIYNFHTIQ